MSRATRTGRASYSHIAPLYDLRDRFIPDACPRPRPEGAKFIVARPLP